MKVFSECLSFITLPVVFGAIRNVSSTDRFAFVVVVEWGQQIQKTSTQDRQLDPMDTDGFE